MDFLPTLGTTLFSGMVGALATQLFSWQRERRQREDDQGYSALRIAHNLEKFASACATHVYDIRNYISSEKHVGHPHFKLPEFEAFPEDINWRLIHTDLTSAIFDLTSLVQSSTDIVQFTVAVLDNDDALQECVDRCLHAGLKALQQAEELRTKYRLPPMNPDLKSDVFEEASV